MSDHTEHMLEMGRIMPKGGMMDEKLAMVLKELGTEGIEAFYVYLAVDYASLWVLAGLVTWGARALWKKLKDDL